MADVTISSLPSGSLNLSSIIPIVNNDITQKTTLSLLSSLPFIPKAWVNFDGRGTIGQNQSIRGSYNVERVYKDSTGNFTIYFASPLSNANYVWHGTAGKTPGKDVLVQPFPDSTPIIETTRFSINCQSRGPIVGSTDEQYVLISVFGT